MASKPLRPCRHPGCGALTRVGWCASHRPTHQRRESADYHSWYGRPIWTDILRPDQLLTEPFCRACARDGVRTKATVADHVVPHRGDWTLFTDSGNLQSLCKRCHDKKTAQEQRETKQK